MAFSFSHRPVQRIQSPNRPPANIVDTLIETDGGYRLYRVEDWPSQQASQAKRLTGQGRRLELRPRWLGS